MCAAVIIAVSVITQRSLQNMFGFHYDSTTQTSPQNVCSCHNGSITQSSLQNVFGFHYDSTTQTSPQNVCSFHDSITQTSPQNVYGFHYDTKFLQNICSFHNDRLTSCTHLYCGYLRLSQTADMLCALSPLLFHYHMVCADTGHPPRLIADMKPHKLCTT